MEHAFKSRVSLIKWLVPNFIDEVLISSITFCIIFLSMFVADKRSIFDMLRLNLGGGGAGKVKQKREKSAQDM
jgi:hypothetical protein